MMNKSRDNLEIAQVVEAKSFYQRGRGLMFRPSWPQNTALWIHRCNSIHTCFMRFAIDVVFVDSELVIQKTFASLPAWRMTLPVWRASSVFEFVSGQGILENLQPGEQLDVGH